MTWQFFSLYVCCSYFLFASNIIGSNTFSSRISYESSSIIFCTWLLLICTCSSIIINIERRILKVKGEGIDLSYQIAVHLKIVYSRYTQMLCFQSIIFSFNGGGGPEKSIPNALVANSRNFTAHG